MSMYNFVLLDLLYGEEMLDYGGSDWISVPHKWVDPTNGIVVSASLHSILWYYERNSEFFLNCSISSNPAKESYTIKDFAGMIDKLPDSESLMNLLKPIISADVITKQYVTRCTRCGKWYSSTLNTIARREGLYCKDCAADVKLLKSNGSISDRVNGIEDYWSEKNPLPPSKCPIGGSVIQQRKYIVICPMCGSEITKRLDSILENGAYCGPCAKRRNVSPEKSLFERSPSVAMMFDKAENYDKFGKRISSRGISAFSSEKYNFYCDNGGVGHTFKKYLPNMIKAHDKGNLGCPVCAGFELRSGVNDFATKVPSLAKYWDEEKNGFPVSQVFYNDQKEYWWVCPNGHSFQRDPLHMQRSVGTSTLGCPVCHGKEVRVGVNDLLTLRPDLMEYWDWENNEGYSPNDYTIQSNIKFWWKCKRCGESFLYPIDARVRTNGLCEECRKSNYSKSEKELVDYIKLLGFDVREEAHIYSNPAMSADIYIPSKKIAIEYNGVFWHSDAVREDPMYHYKKYIDLKKRGITQYTVWEDDYSNPQKQPIVLKSVRRLLGVSNERQVNARDCEAILIDKFSAEKFLNDHHIQGFVGGSDYVGVVEKSTNGLVAVAVFLDNGSGSRYLQLSRYATSCNVRGGFSKIITTVEKYNKDKYGGVYTFSDNLISSGNLYKTCGFSVIEELKPDYMYVYNGVRVHKFNFRKERFQKDKDLLYREGLTERQLAELNGIPRIYDAGKLKWLYTFK